jgi:antitoxin MazE
MSTTTKKLTRTGNSVALVLERAWLDETGIDIDLPVEVSTHGDAIVVTRARTKQRKRKLAEVVADAHRRYGPVFKKLAE